MSLESAPLERSCETTRNSSSPQRPISSSGLSACASAIPHLFHHGFAGACAVGLAQLMCLVNDHP